MKSTMGIPFNVLPCSVATLQVPDKQLNRQKKKIYEFFFFNDEVPRLVEL